MDTGLRDEAKAKLDPAPPDSIRASSSSSRASSRPVAPLLAIDPESPPAWALDEDASETDYTALPRRR